MNNIDKILGKIFKTKGGFDFNITHFEICNRYKLYPKIHIYDNTWYLFLQIEYKSMGYQLNIWNHYKYQEYTDVELQYPNDGNI